MTSILTFALLVSAHGATTNPIGKVILMISALEGKVISSTKRKRAASSKIATQLKRRSISAKAIWMRRKKG